jgi:hypothetical protein
MKHQDLVKSFISRASITIQWDDDCPNCGYAKKYLRSLCPNHRVVKKKLYNGWLSKKQIDFLDNLCSRDPKEPLQLFPGEGGYYDGIENLTFYIKRGMPNGARAFEAKEIIEEKYINQQIGEEKPNEYEFIKSESKLKANKRK